MTTVVTLKNGRDFEYGRKYAKKHNGIYNSTTREWSIPGNHTGVREYFATCRVVNGSSPTIDEIYRDWSGNENSQY